MAARAWVLSVALTWFGGQVDAQDLTPDSGVTREEAQQRVAELESAVGLDEVQRTQLTDLYRLIVKEIDAERSAEKRAEVFRQAVELDPPETVGLRQQLVEERASTPVELERTEGETADELQLRLTTHQTELARLTADLGELERTVASEQARPAEVQGLMAERRSLIGQIETQLSAEAAPGPDATEEERAARALLVWRIRARAAEVAMLEQEQISNAARVDRLKARTELAAWQVSQTELRETQLRTWLSELRQAQAQRARTEAEQLRDEALGKHPLIQELAEDIASISLRTQNIIPKILEAAALKQVVDDRLEQMNADFAETERLIDVGITTAVGTVLLERRRALPNARSFRRTASERSVEVADARLELFGVERQIKTPAEYEVELDQLLSGPETADLSEQDRDNLRTDLSALAVTKAENLILLESALREYQYSVSALEIQETALVKTAGRLATILDKNLIWIPNAPALSAGDFRILRDDLPKLASSKLWSEAADVLRRDFRESFTSWAVTLLVLAGLLLSRRRMRARLEQIASKVGRVREDAIRLTFEAILLQALVTLPVPAAFALMGWRLVVVFHSNESSKAVGAGFMAAFCVAFICQFLRNLFRENGIGRAHFRWTGNSGRIIRRHLLWFQAIALPATFLIAVSEAQSDPVVRYGPGRLAFITLMLASIALAYFLLHSSRGVFVGRSLEQASAWLRRSRPAWMPLGMLVLIALAVMAASGYYYAALQLEYRLNQTLLIILFALFMHASSLRWLMVSQRRLALKIAIERRAAHAKQHEAEEGELSATIDGPIESSEELDVAEIGDQAKDLLRVSVGLFVVVAIWFAWAGVLPALGMLDTVPLWHYEAILDGEPQQVPITLANLGLALFTLAITMTAARNMPGFLEIALLQRLPLDPGVRYATRTLALYAIVTIGILVAFNAIGVGWSSVQWMVAALTVGLGFGLQEIFANFVSGLIILLERPVRIGDTVTVADTSGVVTRIRMRATTITDWNRRELIIPNKSFITGELINWSLSDPILRLDFVVGIAYGSDTTLAHKTMLDVCRAHPLVLDKPESNVFFSNFGDNSLNFDLRVFVSERTHTGRSRILHDLHMAIDQACREKGITIAFPQRDLHLKSADAVLRVAVEGAPES